MAENEHIFAAVTDLETTGLNANEDVPLEIGVKLIDKEGFVFAQFESLIYEEIDEFQRAIVRGKRNQFVGPMHERSGLWNDLEMIGHSSLKHTSRDAVDNALCDFLTDNGVRFGTVPMFGNSIGSLDRPFSLVHLPMFNAALSYRNIDMSTLKELCKAVNPGLYENLKPIIGNKDAATHRVMDDIDACIVEYRAYLDNFLIQED